MPALHPLLPLLRCAAGPCRLALLLAAVLLLTGAAIARAQDGAVFPLLLRLEGVGAVYGAGGAFAPGAHDGGRVLAGISGGAVQAAGALLRGQPLAGRWRLDAFAAYVREAQLVTSYTRGTALDDPVRQKLAGGGLGAAMTYDPGASGPTFAAGLAQSSVALEGYETLDGQPIPLPGANLHDVNTTHLRLTAGWRHADAVARPTRGIALGAGLGVQAGRTGQSDVLEQSLRATAYVPLGGRVTWATHLRLHDARPLRRAEAYDSEAEVAAALDADCTAVPDAAARARCVALAAGLARYIAASNRNGTATPLGGSTSLRAYRELRFRAAHTRLAATELRVRAGETLELVAFVERGFAADDRAAVYDVARDSAGLGVRFWLGDLPVRLEGADGDEGGAWFLTAGAAW